MLHKTPKGKPKSKLKSRYSKILLVAIGVVIATGSLVIGGTLAGWDIAGWLVSPMALLVYFLLVAAAMVAILLKLKNREE